MALLRVARAALLFVLCGLLVALPAAIVSETERDHDFSSCISADGQFFARCTFANLAIYDLQTGQTHRLPDWGHVGFVPKSDLLVCGGNHALTVWNWRNGTVVHSWPGVNRWSYRVAITADGAKVAGADDRSLRIWELASGKLLETIPLDREQDAITFSPDGTRIYSGASGHDNNGRNAHVINAWSLPGGQLAATLIGPEHCIIRSLAISPDGKTLAAALSINALRLWNLEDRAEKWLAEDVASNYDSLAFFAEGRWLAVGGHRGLTVFSPNDPNSRHSIDSPQRAGIHSIRPIDAKGKVLAAAGDRVLEFDPETFETNVLRAGLTLRNHPIQVIAWGFAGWAAAWIFVCRPLRRRASDETQSTEAFACFIVLGTAVYSAAHWGLLFAVVRSGWQLVDPIRAMGWFAASWVLPIIFIGLLMSVSRRRAFAFGFFAIAVILGQMAFELWLLTQIIASV